MTTSSIFHMPSAIAPRRCISLHRPWAQWVMLGWKPIETRTHQRFAGLVGERIGIHAALKWDESETTMAGLAMLTTQQRDGMLEHQSLNPAFWQGGRLLGTVKVYGFRELCGGDARKALIECRTPRFGLFLEAPELFPTPIPLKGAQGIFFYRA